MVAGKQVYMVTDKVTKEVKDMVGEYNEYLYLFKGIRRRYIIGKQNRK